MGNDSNISPYCSDPSCASCKELREAIEGRRPDTGTGLPESWRVLWERAANERDPDRVIQLLNEIDLLLTRKTPGANRQSPRFTRAA